MNSKPDYAVFIGFGNPLRGDDGVGPYAARELRRWGLNAIDVQQLTPELAELLARFELAVFIDADVSLQPGEVRVHDLPCSGAGPLEHHVGPCTILRLARDLYGHAPHAVLIAIGGECYDFHEGLSETVMRAVEQVLDTCLTPA